MDISESKNGSDTGLANLRGELMKSSLLGVLFLSLWVMTQSGCGGSGEDPVMCTGPGTPVFPTFDKTCSIPGDCVIGLHRISCCGTLRAIGLTQAEKARFDADEKRCVAMDPGCPCPQGPTTAEDGQEAGNGKTI